MTLFLLPLILAQLAPPPPRPTLPRVPTIVGTVVSVGRSDWYGTPAIAAIADDGKRHRWSANRTVVRFEGRPGDWPVGYLLVGDRVVAADEWSWAWQENPVMTVVTGRDPDLIAILATERSVARFRQQAWPPPPHLIPPAHLRAIRGLGAPCYRCRESASRRLTHLGGPGVVRSLAWAEHHRDAETSHRAAVAIGCVLRGEGVLNGEVFGEERTGEASRP